MPSERKVNLLFSMGVLTSKGSSMANWRTCMANWRTLKCCHVIHVPLLDTCGTNKQRSLWCFRSCFLGCHILLSPGIHTLYVAIDFTLQGFTPVFKISACPVARDKEILVRTSNFWANFHCFTLHNLSKHHQDKQVFEQRQILNTASVRNFSLSCGPRQANFWQDKQLFGNFSLFQITSFFNTSLGQARFSDKFRTLILCTSILVIRSVSAFCNFHNFFSFHQLSPVLPSVVDWNF